MSDSVQPRCSLPVSPIYGIFQARILGVGCHSLLQRYLPNSGIELVSLMSLALAGRFFTTSATWEAPRQVAAAAKSRQAPVPGILQARTLEWVDISFSRA